MRADSSAFIKIVEALFSFEAAGMARAWALKHVRGRTVMNKQLDITINIGRRAIEKTISESAIHKSANVAAHLAAMTVLPRLLEEAILTESHSDRNNDPNIRQVHRFCAALRFQKELFRAKLTVKEFVQTIQGRGFYSYELTQIEMPAWKQADSFSEEQTSAPRAGIITLAKLLENARNNRRK